VAMRVGGAYAIRALSDLCVGNSIGLSRDRSGLSRRFILPPLEAPARPGLFFYSSAEESPGLPERTGLEVDRVRHLKSPASPAQSNPRAAFRFPRTGDDD
jgi:hypothetical protein